MNSAAFSLVIVSAIMHASWNFFTKRSTANKISMLWLGWLLAGLFTFPYAVYTTDFSHASNIWIPFFVATTIAHALYIYMLGHSYSIGEMSLIYPMARGFGIFLTLVIVTSIGLETVELRGLLGILLLGSGIVLICIKRINDLEKRTAMKAALMVGCCVSSYSIIDKMSLEYIPPVFYMSLMFILSPLSMTPIMVKKYATQTKLVISKYKFYSFSVGLVSFCTYLLILFALQDSRASYVVALREVSIVFGSILGIWYFKEEKNKRKLLGILIILVGAVVIKTS